MAKRLKDVQARSYTVVEKHGKGLMVVESHFVPGYSSLHLPSEEEAIKAFIKERESEIEEIKSVIDSAKRLLE